MPKHARAKATHANKAKKRITRFRVKAHSAFERGRAKASKGKK